ncbi:uncharacterized protein LOC108858504 [Raphanus sativus]|uniref:Uncharacterized protein LOC108858504 n=1 Tax=Raphanus sativus TaxID=3726 RepID=A0A6J0NUW9_RAPSA|nr:uncharacterized protein LOC108858504 [Raphanus sativus]
MVNSESHSSSDQVPPSTPHVDGFTVSARKLLDCAHHLPKVQELATKVASEAFKAAILNDEEGKFSDYMKGGACKESFVALAECPDGFKQLSGMFDCMDAHSDYYEKYKKEIIYEQIEKEFVKELDSTFPGGEVEVFLGIHEFFTKGEGGCCKEQYLASVDCVIEEEDQSDPLLTTFTKRLFRFL